MRKPCSRTSWSNGLNSIVQCVCVSSGVANASCHVPSARSRTMPNSMSVGTADDVSVKNLGEAGAAYPRLRRRGDRNEVRSRTRTEISTPRPKMVQRCVGKTPRTSTVSEDSAASTNTHDRGARRSRRRRHLRPAASVLRTATVAVEPASVPRGA